MKAREYMKDMNRKQKIDYIWDYYKVHIIVGLIVIIFSGIFISESINKKNYVFNFTIVGNCIDTSKQEKLEKEATKLLVGKTDSKDQVLFDFIYQNKKDDGTLELDSAMQQKLIIRTAVGEIDAAVLDENLFRQFAAQGAVLKLDGLNGLEPGNMEKVKTKGGSGVEETYGIRADSIQKLKNISYDSQGKILCIIAKTEDPAAAVKFINWLVK